MTDLEKSTTHLIPRGTDRVRRRAQQAEAKVLSEKEVAELISPSGPEKDAAIGAAQKREKDKFGTDPNARTRRRVLQAEHKAQADAEAATVVSREPDPPTLAGFRPGQQVDHITARQIMRRHDRAARNVNMQVAQTVAKATLGVLNGRQDIPVRAKHRRAAKHEAAIVAAKKQG